MPRDTSPTIKEVRVRAVRVPMTEPHQTASGVIKESPLVLTDVITDTGISWSQYGVYLHAGSTQADCAADPELRGLGAG